MKNRDYFLFKYKYLKCEETEKGNEVTLWNKTPYYSIDAGWVDGWFSYYININNKEYYGELVDDFDETLESLKI